MVQSSDGLLTVDGIGLVSLSCFLQCDELIKLCDELIKLHQCWLKFVATNMSISLSKSKTDQYKESSSVLVAWSGTQTCPGAMLEHYLEKATLDCTLQFEGFSILGECPHQS